MLITALLVGGWTAWYLGVRAGIYAAGITFALLFVALVAPTNIRLVCYGVLAVGVVGVSVAGKRLMPAESRKFQRSVVWAKTQIQRYIRKNGPRPPRAGAGG
jgi:hypothetical protein